MKKKAINLVAVRQELHKIPEPAFQEFKTRELILKHLQAIEGIKIQTFKKSTGILVEYSQGKGPYLLFRSDMDALPIRENTGVDFASQHDGMMHACGHDIHMTVLLGLIYKVAEASLQANLLFLFQPAEEGMGGAESILSEGLVQSYQIKTAFALHVSGSLPLGTVSSKAGIFFAIPQEFDVEFKGKAAHAAFPEKGKNALKGGVEFLVDIHKYIERLQKKQQVIFNIGVANSGNIRNIIPDKCLLQGTHRTLDKAMRDKVNAAIRQLADTTAEDHGLNSKVSLLCTYDPVVNNVELYHELKKACGELEVRFQQSKTFFTGEDFGFFTTLYPGILFWLGAGKQAHDLHSDKFMPDEGCIRTGVDVFYQLIRQVNS